METDIDARLGAIAAVQHGLVTDHDTAEVGATRGQVRHRVGAGRWIRVHHGVYRLVGAPVTWRQQLLAAVFAAGIGAAACGRSAAAIDGLPGFADGPLLVTVPRHHARPVSTARVHESLFLPDHHLRTVDGIPLTTVARTLFDLAGSEHPRRSERALDHALARNLVTVPACWRVLDELAEHGRTGTVVFRTLLSARNGDFVAPASELERRLIQLLLAHGLPMPAREIDVGDRDGWVGRVELVYPDCALLIEADSRLHHSSFLDQQADRARDNRFMAAGYRVLRFTWDDVVHRAAWVATTVRRARDAHRPAA